MAEASRPLNPKQIEGLNSSKVGIAIKWMSKAQTFVFKKTKGKFGNKGKPRHDGPKSFEARPPRPEKKMDPDSPFAILASLKNKT